MSYTTFTVKDAIENCMIAIGYTSVDVTVVEDDYRIYLYTAEDHVPSALLDSVYKLYPQAVIGVFSYNSHLAVALMPNLMY